MIQTIAFLRLRQQSKRMAFFEQKKSHSRGEQEFNCVMAPLTKWKRQRARERVHGEAFFSH